MVSNNDNTQRQYLYNEIAKRFDKSVLWSQIEEIAHLRCADLPEPISEAALKRFTQGVLLLKEAIAELGIRKEHLTFLDEEIERLAHTKQITLYEEQEDGVDKETLDKFLRLHNMQEGVIGINDNYTYGQLRRITKYIYEHTASLKFFIGNEHTLRGTIKAELMEYVQEVTVARVLVPKNPNLPTQVMLFGDPYNSRDFVQAKEVTASFHCYSFVDEQQREYMLLSVDAVELGEYEIHGNMVKIMDKKKISESSRLPTWLPFFFLREAIGTVMKYQSLAEYHAARTQLADARVTLFNYPFAITTRNKQTGKYTEVIGRHPRWFKYLIWAWLLHAPQGIGQQQSLALTIIGPPKSGKSILFQRLHKITMEAQPIFKGEDSTIKGLVPSFRKIPPERGYLCDSKRCAYIDEFYRCLSSINDYDARSEALGRMNSLLDQEKVTFSTGMGTLRLQMNARILFANNPPRGFNTIEDVLQKYDKAFNSRTLIYWQHEQSKHAQMIRQCKERDFTTYEGSLQHHEFVGFLDFLWSFSCEWKQEYVDEIYEEPVPLLTETQRNHYEARHKHHLECLMDGIIKTRVFLDGGDRFVALAEDYTQLREVWTQVIRSWIDAEHIKKLPVGRRAEYLPETAQWLWKQIKEERRRLSRAEVEVIGRKGMEIHEFYVAYTILRSNGLVADDSDDGSIIPYFLDPRSKHLEEKLLVVETRFVGEE